MVQIPQGDPPAKSGEPGENPTPHTLTSAENPHRRGQPYPVGFELVLRWAGSQRLHPSSGVNGYHSAGSSGSSQPLIGNCAS